jgi:hypothetical protein
MDALDLFFKKYAYKFPKGYPDMNNEQDINILADLLEGLGMNLNEIETSNPKTNIDPLVKDAASKDKKLTKLDSFTELANLTYKQYDLGDIKKVFPLPVNTIKDWKNYVDKNLSNTGRSVENALKNYSISLGVESKEISGKGEDISIGGKIVEIKSSAGNKINTQLQTSFYTKDSNKFYAFVSNTSDNDIQIRIVASAILYRLALGDQIADEIEAKGGSDVLIDQIENGLKTLDLKKFILSSILTGKTSEGSKSFFIGDNNQIRCRFVIYIEPK